MCTQSFNLILCDLGNVLIPFDHRIAVRRVQPFTDKTFEEIHRLFFDSPLARDFEEGRLASSDFFGRLSGELSFKGLTFEAFVPLWNEIFFENEEVLGLLRSLKKKYKLCLVSNINELHYRYLQTFFPRYFEVFDALYLSFEVGRSKPEREFYLKALREQGVRPEETLYIDDREDLVRAGEKLGMRSVRFEGAERLVKQMKKMKVPF